MIISKSELSRRVLEICKQQDPTNFEKVKAKDIERLIKYFGYTISLIIKKGGFLTLQTYRTRKRECCIRIAPKERNLVYKELYFRIVRTNIVFKPRNQK